MGKRLRKHICSLKYGIDDATPEDAIKKIREAVREAEKQGFYDFKIEVETEDEPYYGGCNASAEVNLVGRPPSKVKVKK